MSGKKTKTNISFLFKPAHVMPDIIEASSTWEYVCVPIPVPLIPYLTPIMRIFQTPYHLSGTPEQKELFIILWTKLIADINSSGVCQDLLMLRQNPANSCQLQQSLDGGSSWFLAFDYSLCRNRSVDIFVELTNNQIFNDWSQTTTNTEININAPLLTFTSSTGETEERIADRKLALCYACHQYIDLYCEIIKEINQDATAAGNISVLALGVVVALGTAGAIVSFGTSTLLAMAIAAAVGTLGLATYSALSEAVLDDQVARSAVACLMYATLRDQAPTAENFAASVNADVLDGNAELIRATLANDISNATGLENQFNAFINLLGDALRPAELGLIDDCPCVDEVIWEYDADLAALEAWDDVTSDDKGIWEPEGWAANPASSFAGTAMFGIATTAPFHCLSVQPYIDLPQTGDENTVFAGDLELFSAVSDIMGSATNFELPVDLTIDGLAIGYFPNASGAGSPNFPGHTYRVIVRGIGYQPPELGG